MRVLVVRQPADQAPGQQGQPAHKRGLQAQVNRQAEPKVVGHDGDDEGDEDSNDEAHRCTLWLPQANALPHLSASAWITGQRPACRMPLKNRSNISEKDDKDLTMAGVRLNCRGVLHPCRMPRRPISRPGTMAVERHFGTGSAQFGPYTEPHSHPSPARSSASAPPAAY